MAPLPRLEPLRYARTDALEVAYYEAGPSDGEVALLLHGFPYDIHSHVDVIPRLAGAAHRFIAPYLRGHGPTRFLDSTAPRSGQQASIGADVIALMDALEIPHAALWPERCAGTVSVNSYLIQDIGRAMTPIRPDLEAGSGYFYYFLTKRGRARSHSEPARNREGDLDATTPRTGNSTTQRLTAPPWPSTIPTTSRWCFTPIVIASDSHPAALRTRRSRRGSLEQPAITVAVTLDGLADGNFPATDGSASAHLFTGPRVHRQVPNAGHNLPQEAPDAFASAILEVADLGLANLRSPSGGA